MMDYFDRLDPQQRAAVIYGDGPLLIFGGAGTGKTHVLTCRIAHLIRAREIAPESILAVSSTAKTVNVMNERLEWLLDMPCRRARKPNGVWVGTFPSICHAILQKNINRFGYKRSFVLYDESERLLLIKECMSQLVIDSDRFLPRAIVARISSLKNRLITADQFKACPDSAWDIAFYRIYALFEEKLRAAEGIDNDDHLILTVKLLDQHPDVLDYYQNLFRYILVDDCQNMNHAQIRIIQSLVGKSSNICVAGDEDQRIGQSNETDMSSIADFQNHYLSATVLTLEQNYRSSRTILDTGLAVVSHNHSRKATKLLTQRHLRNKITCYEATDEWDEARFICQTIEQLQRDGRSLDEIAVLCRFNVQANAIEAALGNWCLPFRNVPALRFYDRSGIRDIIAYLKVLQNPLDVDSLRRILRVPVFAGDETTLMELERAAALDIVDLDKIFMNPDAANITPSLRKMLRDFNGTIDEIRAAMASLPISKLVRCVIQNTGYGAAINRDNSVIGQSMVENLGEFMVDIKNFEKHNIDAPLELFLYSVELAADYNSELTSDAMVYGTNMVTLMTLAEARGQEYSVVFIAGMEEGILPHSGSAESREALEGDRRLFYLGLTRAKERLIISHAKERSLYGYPQPYTVSRFIEEIPQGAINYTDGASCALS